MAYDDFDLPELADAPLELPMAPAAPTMPQTPQTPQGPQGGGWARLMPMLPLLAAAGKQGGRAGIAAFLQGMQQAKARKQQEARLGQQDARQARMDQSNEDHRQQQLMLAAETRRQQDEQRKTALMQQFGTALNGVDDPEAVNALLEFYGPQADRIGVGRPMLERFAMQTATPTRLQKKAATARIDKLKTQFATKWMEEGAKFMHDLPGGERVTFQDLLTRAGMTPDPAAPQMAATSKISPDVPLDRQHAAALASGDAETAKLILDSMRQQDEVKRDPRQSDPVLAEMRQLRLEQMRSGGLTPTQRANVIGSRRSQWQRFSKAVTDRELAVSKVDSGLAALARGNRNAATQAIILAFNKLQDETSVVREGEYARSEQLAPILSRIEGAFTKISAGGGALTNKDLQDLAFEAKETARALMAISNEAAANLRQGIEEELNDYQIPPSRVFGGSTVGVRAQPTEEPSGPAAGAGVSYQDYLRSRGQK